MTAHTAGPCPLCREHHAPDRGLSFDGHGVNGCDMYRRRLAKFPESVRDAERLYYGPLFAAAPATAAMLERALDALAALYANCAMVHKHWGENDNQKEADAAIAVGRAILKEAGRV